MKRYSYAIFFFYFGLMVSMASGRLRSNHPHNSCLRMSPASGPCTARIRTEPPRRSTWTYSKRDL